MNRSINQKHIIDNQFSSYDQLIQNKNNTFTFFQLYKPNILEENDIKTRDELISKFRSKRNIIHNLALLGSFMLVYGLGQRNIIFYYARRQSIWEFTKKYFLIPNIITKELMYPDEEQLLKQVNQIVNKYEFSHPQYREQFELIKQERSSNNFNK